MFLSTLYTTKGLKYLFAFFGWGVTLPLTIINFLKSNYTPESSPFGAEFILPPFSFYSMLLITFMMIASLAFTIVFFNLHRIRPRNKRRITHVCVTYIFFWFFYLCEATGLFFLLFNGAGIILIRLLLAITAFLTILAWTGKENFLKALKDIFSSLL